MLLIEQNLGVAIDVADTVGVMVNGRIARMMSAAELGANRELQHQLLGVRARRREPTRRRRRRPRRRARPSSASTPSAAPATMRRRPASPPPADARAVRGFTRWNAADPQAPLVDRPVVDRPAVGPRDALIEGRGDKGDALPSFEGSSAALSASAAEGRVLEFPVATTERRAAYVAGTFDTKGRELLYLRDCLEKLGLRTVTVDLATSGRPSSATVHPREVARHHPRGERAVFTDDRGSAVSQMAVAFAHFIEKRRDVGGLISAGGSGGTSLATAAMRRLPIGVPKVMVSTVASGDVKPYVGPSDIMMMYSVTDVSGINRISQRVLGNAAHALAGMMVYAPPARSRRRHQAGRGAHHVRPHHALRAGDHQGARGDATTAWCSTPPAPAASRWRSWSSSGMIAGVLDITTTEIADELVGGVLTAGPERLDAIIRSRVPYVGSCGALDMVNFWAMETVPARFRDRKLYKHNDNVTLMRTTAEECGRIGRFIVDKLNRMEGPVRFLIPDGGVSGLDAPGKPFWDPAADKALFDAIATNFRAGSNRKLIRAAAQHQRSRIRRGGRGRLRGRRPPGGGRRPGAAAIARSGPDMPRIARKTILEKFARHDRPRPADHRRRRRHRPLRQVRGGRRHRPDRDLQFGPLPHGRARLAGRPAGLRQRQRRGRRHGPGSAAGGAPHAGAGRRQRHRSLHDPRRRSCAAWPASASRASRTSPASG